MTTGRINQVATSFFGPLRRRTNTGGRNQEPRVRTDDAHAQKHRNNTHRSARWTLVATIYRREHATGGARKQPTCRTTRAYGTYPAYLPLFNDPHASGRAAARATLDGRGPFAIRTFRVMDTRRRKRVTKHAVDLPFAGADFTGPSEQVKKSLRDRTSRLGTLLRMGRSPLEWSSPTSQPGSRWIACPPRKFSEIFGRVRISC